MTTTTNAAARNRQALRLLIDLLSTPENRPGSVDTPHVEVLEDRLGAIVDVLTGAAEAAGGPDSRQVQEFLDRGEGAEWVAGAVDRPEDALTDDEATRRFSSDLYDTRRDLMTAFYSASMVKHEADRLPEYVRRHVFEAWGILSETVEKIERLEDEFIHLDGRLRWARLGLPDPSTMTPEERRRWRANGLIEAARKATEEGGR